MTDILHRGLYERVVDRALAETLGATGDTRQVYDHAPLDAGDSHAVLARHLSHLIEATLRRLPTRERLVHQRDLVNEIVATLAQRDEAVSVTIDTLPDTVEQLLSVRDSQAPTLMRADTPASQTSLLTGTRLDPSLISQLKLELASADRVDFLCSFIKWSGLDMLRDALEAFCARPEARLRVITTAYMGATDHAAAAFLANLPQTEVKVSYDNQRTRLHAKAYLFERDSGFSTAYIGSANLSRPALMEGLEWTLKATEYADAPIWNKVAATFESYWGDDEFEPFDSDKFRKALADQRGVTSNHAVLPSFELKPFTFQREVMDLLAADRETPDTAIRQLVVAATGTGKTMIAAFDYRREVQQQDGSYPTLLFVAHRREILLQALGMFRAALRDQNFGDLFDGRSEPAQIDHLFATIQTLGRRDWIGQHGSERYAYVVVDEAHHGTADSYRQVLANIAPHILLGLTATPERADGLDITQFFNHRIAAEIRLPDAISRRLVVPFHYFGLTDSVDYDQLQWQRGGYARDGLENVLSANDLRAQLVLDQCCKRLLDVQKARGIGFCVSVAHAQFMARFFSSRGIASLALSANSLASERDGARYQLRNREINFIFVVDLYNEGIDIPEIDTLLFLRPTESLTVFLQQLGRGLRLTDNKDYVAVLDFVGRMHQRFRFDARLRALLPPSSRALKHEIAGGFAHLPAGCSMTLERQAERYILENIEAATRRGRAAIERYIAEFESITGNLPTLDRFLSYHDLELDDVYRRANWSRLCAAAGVREQFESPDEKLLTDWLRRIAHVDDAQRLDAWQAWLDGENDVNQALLLCLLAPLIDRAGERALDTPEACRRLLDRNPTLREDAATLLAYRARQPGTRRSTTEPTLGDLDFVVHATYTREEMLVLSGARTWTRKVEHREGSLHVESLKLDLFFVTLNKTEKDYSPSTLYEDYAIDAERFHWQSQSTTSDASPTGQRYIHHAVEGYRELMFVREERKIQGLACPYTFLGTVTYRSHTGSRPISIIWQLNTPLPARLLRTTRRLLSA
ncbi:MAG: DUF3427 domain-containing protein [Salinisphaera sp.]|jgi:superfamily II DNA or RNA helicase/HKD family nuclease|nr:DUF3427 domain-containing protein [Salinisphaera sp.]